VLHLQFQGTASALSESCASAGTCAAGGEYADRHHHSQVFVAAERDGRWGRAIEVPGMCTLNASGNAEITILVSCAPAGTCAAGGDYWDRRGRPQGFVVSQTGQGQAQAWYPPARHPGQDHDHVRETRTSPPAARPRLVGGAAGMSPDSGCHLSERSGQA
jgi:hypothetical protein